MDLLSHACRSGYHAVARSPCADRAEATMADGPPIHLPDRSGLPWDRVHRVEAHVATGDLIDVRHFHVAERMSSLFEVRLVAVSENPDIEFEAVIGKPMTFLAQGAETRTWAG